VRKQKYLLLRLIVLLFYVTVYPENQEQDSARAIIHDDYEKALLSIDRYLKKYEETAVSVAVKADNSRLFSVDSLLTKEDAEDSALSNVIRSKKKVMADLKRDFGLSFESGGRYNSIGLKKIDYSRSIYSGVVWNLLENGLIANRTLARQNETQMVIDSLVNQGDRLQKYNAFAQAQVLSHCERMMRCLLADKYAVLTSYLHIVNWLYELGRLPYENVLSVNGDLLETGTALDNHNIAVDNELAAYVPIIDDLVEPRIDSSALFTAMRNDRTHQGLLHAQQEIIKNKHRYWNYFQASAYGRYVLVRYPAADNNTDKTVEHGFVVGANLSIPIANPLRSLTALEINTLKLQRQKDLNDRLYTVGKLYRESMEIHNKLALLQVRILCLKEQLHHEYQARLSPTYDAASAIRSLLSIIAAATSLIENKVSLYVKLFEISDHCGIAFCNLPSTAAGNMAANTPAVQGSDTIDRPSAKRYVYIWSDVFNNIANGTLLEFLDKEGINTAVIAFSHAVQKTKLKEFVTAAKNRAIRTECMFSTNEWIFPKRKAVIVKTIQTVYETFDTIDGIHLDIEPHVLPDFSANKELYFTYYIEMLKTIRAALKPSTPLSVSVSLVFPDSCLSAIFPLVDNVFFMVYGRRYIGPWNAATLTKVQMNIEKTVIAFRPQDFQSKKMLEDFMRQINRATSIRKFAFHELKQLIQLTR
jgi:hypothetical protein